MMVVPLCSCKGGTLRLTPRSYLTICPECGGARFIEAQPATAAVVPR